MCSAALALLVLTGCEGADLYGVTSPDWISEKIDSIENAKKGDVEVLEGMDVVEKIQNVVTDKGNNDRPLQDIIILKASVIR